MKGSRYEAAVPLVSARADGAVMDRAYGARGVHRDSAMLVLDVRGPDEFSGPLGHIREAKNLPLKELPTQLSDLVRDSRPVVLVCKTDRRSSMAAQQLQQAGMADVSVLRGGMEQWRALGLPTLK